MVNFWSITFATGARQLVVHDALDKTLCFDISSVSSLTPIQTVISGSLAGAEIITHPAPALKCFDAPSLSTKFPVDSSAMSTFKSFHGSCEGSVIEVTCISLPFITMFCSLI